MEKLTSGCRPWLAAIGALAAVVPIAAQPSARIATSLDALLKFPGFFHSRAVAVLAQPVETDAVWRLPVEAPRTLLVVPRTGTPPSGVSELRGVFVDVGRLIQNRELTVFPALTTLVQSLYADREPARGTVFALAEATWMEPPELSPPSLRALALNPSAFDGKTITLRGRFRAQNLFGDLPFWPRQSRWDFVLQAADASAWVTGLRPRGRGFDLDPTSKRSAGTWLEVTGTVRLQDATPRLEATTVAESQPENEPDAEPAVELPPQPAPAMIFSAPVNGETDVPRTTVVRVQFSRDMAPASFTGRVQVTYAAGVTEPVPPFTASYRAENRGLDVRFESPLVRGASVLVEFLPGIVATEGTPLAPMGLAFTVER